MQRHHAPIGPDRAEPASGGIDLQAALGHGDGRACRPGLELGADLAAGAVEAQPPGAGRAGRGQHEGHGRVGGVGEQQHRGAVPAGELNLLSNSTFILTYAAREDRVPPGTGTSEVAKTTKSRTYRLSAINSALVPFVGARVEISGEVQASASPDDNPQLPVLQVGFVQRIAKTCS